MFSASQHGLIDDQPLHFIDVGQGPTVVFLHGLFLNSQVWQHQLSQLSSHYRCIAIDLWGHGQSSAIPENTYSLLDVASQIEALLLQLNIEEYHLVGHDCGAAIAAEMILNRPTQIKSLVMLNSFIGFEPQINCLKYQQWLEDIHTQQAIQPQLADTIASLMLAKNLTQETDFADQISSRLQNYNADQAIALAKFAKMAIYKRDTLDLCEQLTLPTLVMVGVENKLRTVLESYLMSEDIDGSELIHIQQAGHIAMLEQAEQVTQVISEFLNKHA
ncbi:alpha/beta fold hydrolase [Shewanella aestuarii]|uniref:Alpha/beta hydrolase n=1 Tax=Shewanella aestuarii TaxID=1028752 RepID=A0A6G9QLI1_9GAMM|nr:alpha/beta hydrolase [Shewanella aestuarii]QIR14719.1 alpha/beta hydrolase [Shewanella aestuarii]